jgi:two-component system response regulator PilR (NtrC family)
VKQGTIGRLKKVSGKLRRIWVGPNRPRKQEGEMRLLVVDGEESICFSMKEYFTMQGYQVDTARELEEAERLVENGDYEVVIQDLRLGPAHRPDGLEMIKFIRNQNPRTIIIVLTAYGSAEMEEEAFRGGADAFLRKPKPLSHVAQVIQGLIETPPHQAAHGAA